MTSATILRCPKCAGDMATYERSGITLDQCRECRGIFLDRGELERLVDAEGGAWVGPQPGVPAGAMHAAPAPMGHAQVAPAPMAGYPHPAYGQAPAAPRYDSRDSRDGRDGRDRDRGGYRSDWDDDDDDRRGSYGRPSRKRSFLGELLEGFGD